MASDEIVAKAYVHLRNHFPGLPEGNTERLTAWASTLAELTDDELRRGVAVVCKMHVYGSPTPAHLFTAIKGRVETLSLECRDLYNRKILDDNGVPKVRRIHARVFPDGSHVEIGDELTELPQARDDRYGMGSIGAHIDGALPELTRGEETE